MKRALAAVVLALAAFPAVATVSIRRLDADHINVNIRDEPLSVAVDAIAPMLTRDVRIVVGDDRLVNVRDPRITPITALHAIVRAANLQLSDENGTWVIRDASEPHLTLDVKDADVHEILASMKKQCAIKNLIVDPKVQGQGTFVLHSVPCHTAFDVVTRTLSLKLVTYENNVVVVSPR